MAQNYICKGDHIPYVVAGSPVVSGQLLKVGSLIGVALGSGAVGIEINFSATGVWKVAKAAPLVIAQGAPLYYDSTPGELTTDDASGANPLAGHAYAAALSADTSVLVKFLH